MDKFRVFIDLHDYVSNKELILKLLSEKLKTHTVEVRCSEFKEIFREHPEVITVSYGQMKQYDAVITDKKNDYIIDLSRRHGKLLRIIK